MLVVTINDASSVVGELRIRRLHEERPVSMYGYQLTGHWGADNALAGEPFQHEGTVTHVRAFGAWALVASCLRHCNADVHE
jgi:hypothetical protein